jgi:lipoprotein NlpI
MRGLLLAVLLLADDPPIPKEKREQILKDCDVRIALATESLKKDPGNSGTYSARGDASFKRGLFAEAAADYDKMVDLDAGLDKSHWRRGIAFFYAGKYDKAAHQFEIYHSFDDVDRENGIWRYFSQYKAYGKEKAQAGLLKYAKDDREPFPSVYKLFEGKLTPEQVIAQVEGATIGDEDKESRRFYAHLYVGLNAAVEGRKEEAAKHLHQAVANRWAPSAGYGPEYMWHVGRVHYDLLVPPK